MSTIDVRFTCGHLLALAANQVSDAPQCSICACKTIAAVKAPPPRFSGACTGPCVVKKD